MSIEIAANNAQTDISQLKARLAFLIGSNLQLMRSLQDWYSDKMLLYRLKGALEEQRWTEALDIIFGAKPKEIRDEDGNRLQISNTTIRELLAIHENVLEIAEIEMDIYRMTEPVAA